MISVEPEKPLASWKSSEIYAGSMLSCLTVILKTSGCAWNRCRMCGYKHERYHPMATPELIARIAGQVAWIREHYSIGEIDMVKIFTSGSFFDEQEVPPAARQIVAEAFRGRLVIAETRPEYVVSESLREFSTQIDDGSWDRPLYVAMGLETTNDRIREKCIDKGNTFQDFIDATAIARECGAGIKTYLLMKPPFLTEREAMEDMHRSIREALPYSDMISMNLCTVQNRTEVEYYWKRGAYRPPYLWSVLEVLAAAPCHVMCDPVGGGQPRGPHNCGACDSEIVKGIREYSLNKDRTLITALKNEECGCKAEWEFVLENERPFCMPLTR
jgi:radical SAM enzyme (TIGR01210 family)